MKPFLDEMEAASVNEVADLRRPDFNDGGQTKLERGEYHKAAEYGDERPSPPNAPALHADGRRRGAGHFVFG